MSNLDGEHVLRWAHAKSPASLSPPPCQAPSLPPDLDRALGTPAVPAVPPFLGCSAGVGICGERSCGAAASAGAAAAGQGPPASPLWPASLPVPVSSSPASLPAPRSLSLLSLSSGHLSYAVLLHFCIHSRKTQMQSSGRYFSKAR